MVENLNLGLRFECEVAALVAVAWFGWHTTPAPAVVTAALVRVCPEPVA